MPLVLAGATSGSATLQATDAQTVTLTLPATTGTLVVTGGAQTIEFADGSAAAPSITNSGDTNTGMFFPAADTIAFSEGGVESMRIDSTGNLVVGDTASGGYAISAKKTNDNCLMRLTAVTAGGAGIDLVNAGGSEVSYINGSGNNVLTFRTSGTERVRIDSNGNMGIGANPQSGVKLDVFSTSANEVVSRSSDTTSYANFIVDVNNGTSQRMQMVSFGSTASGSLLGITRANNSFLAKSGGLLAVGTRDSNALVFGTNELERARIDSNGELLVGTTSGTGAAERFALVQDNSNWVHTLRNSSASQPYGSQIWYTGSDPNNTSNFFFGCYGGGAQTLRLNIRSNGGIANYSGNNVNLSDAREKTNVELAGSYLDKICAIPVKTFNYIDQNIEEDDGLTLGVIAQDVQAVAPELVMESNWAAKDEPEKMRLSIYQTDLQYALMKCIQEQQTIITDLKARIETLENK